MDSSKSIVHLKSTDPATITDDANRPDELVTDLIHYKIRVDHPGDSAQITIYLSEPAPEDSEWYDYNLIDGWQEMNVTFNADRTSLTFTLTDGGVGDADGVANGKIVDPSGLGIISGGSGTGSLSSAGAEGTSGGGCFINTSFSKSDKKGPLTSTLVMVLLSIMTITSAWLINRKKA